MGALILPIETWKNTVAAAEAASKLGHYREAAALLLGNRRFAETITPTVFYRTINGEELGMYSAGDFMNRRRQPFQGYDPPSVSVDFANLSSKNPPHFVLTIGLRNGEKFINIASGDKLNDGIWWVGRAWQRIQDRHFSARKSVKFLLWANALVYLPSRYQSSYTALALF